VPRRPIDADAVPRLLNQHTVRSASRRGFIIVVDGWLVRRLSTSAFQYAYSVAADSTGTYRTTQITDEARVSRTLSYDSLGRLAVAKEAADVAGYQYDPLDDLTDVY
jgi:YD repeat-containing protein